MDLQATELLSLIQRYKSDDETEKAEAEKEILPLLANPPDNLISLLKVLIKQEGYRQISLGKGLIAFGDFAWKAILETADETQDDNTGWAIAWAIGDMKAVRPINDYIEALSHPNVYVRWSAALNIGSFNDPRAVEPLLNIFNIADRLSQEKNTPERYHAKVSHCAAISLRKLMAFAFDRVVAKLEDPEPLVREAAANALIGTEDIRAVEPVSRLLEDPIMEVRKRALEVCETLVEKVTHDQMLLNLLLSQLYEQEPWVQAYAVKPIAKYGLVSMPYLLQMAKDRSVDSQHPHTRYYALNTIQRILWGKPDIQSIYPSLMTTLADLLDVESEQKSDVRYEAIQVVTRIGGDYAVELLGKASKDDTPYVLLAVVEGLSKFPSRTVLSILKELQEKWKDAVDVEADEYTPVEDLKWALETSINEMEDSAQT